jgi:hypothetical protein
VGEADLRNYRLDRSSGELIGFEKLLRFDRELPLEGR